LTSVVDDPKLLELLRRELPIVLGELLAALETLDSGQARRARDNLILYIMSTPSVKEKRLFSALISLAEAILQATCNPCRGLTLLGRALGEEQLEHLMGGEILDAAKRLQHRLKRLCKKA
jgi:hypothetical protein